MKLYYLIKRLLNYSRYFLKGGVAYAKSIGVEIGEGCRIYTSHFGSEPFLIKIGDNVTITSGVKFITHDGSAWLMRDQKGRRYIYQRINIGSNVFVGVNSIIMPGVKIENNVIVAAGSVLTKSVPSGVIVAGVPAKIIGSYLDLERRMLSEFISDEDFPAQNISYKEKILSVVSESSKDYLK